MADATSSEEVVQSSGESSDGSTPEGYRCSLCAHHAASRASLLCHLTNDHSQHLIAVCKLCRQLFPSDQIEAHVLRCKGAHACPYCRSTFALASYLQRHLARRHASMTRPTCNICGKNFSSAGALTTHKRLHNEEMPHSCDFCSARFTQKSHLLLHVDLHHAYVELAHAPKPFTCNTCGRGFLFSVGLQHHRVQHSKRPAEKFVCATCGKKFVYRSEHDRHCLTHSKKAGHQCPFCHKAFVRPNLLRMHILQHTDPGLLTCHYCLRTYSSRSYLLQHLRKHESHVQSPLTSSLSSNSLIELADLGNLSDDCRVDGIPDLLNNEALMNGNNDQLYAKPVVPPDVNFLHSVLYGSEN